MERQRKFKESFKRKIYEDLINSYNQSHQKTSELKELIDLASEENNQELADDLFKELIELKEMLKIVKLNASYQMMLTL